MDSIGNRVGMGADMAGALVNGRYRLIRELGKGAQATVFEVEDKLQGNARVALKVLSTDKMAALFRFEFSQAKRLEHPHIASVFDLGVVQAVDNGTVLTLGAPFFTQELVSGRSSGRRFRDMAVGERPTEAARVGVAVARALELIHARGLLHRDIKPSNILIGDRDDDIKVIDFGLATHKDAFDGLKAGTVGYIAPEALRGVPDERSDLYSLGVTLRELTTGERPAPFDAVPETPPEAVPAPLWEVIRRLADPMPEGRLHSARETVLALARAMGSDILGHGSDELIDAASDTATPSTRAARVRSPKLVGRDGLLSRLVDDFSAAFASREPCIRTRWLVGPPGVGKSRLLHAAIVETQLAAADNGDVPPSFLAGSLRTLMQHIAATIESPSPHLMTWTQGVVPDHPLAGHDVKQDALVVAVAEALLTISQPSVVVIEDGDNPLVVELMNGLAGLPMDEGRTSLVIVAEGRAASPQLGAVEDDGDAPPVIRLSPLEIDDERMIAEQALARPLEGGFMDQLHQATGGLPLLTEAVLAALLALHPDGRIEDASLARLDLTETLDELVLKGFLNGLSPRALEVARFLAVLDDGASGDEIEAAVPHVAGDALFATVTELAKKGWITADGDRFALKGLVSLGLRRTLPETLASRLNAKALETVERRGRFDPARLARLAAGAGMTKKAQALAREAARVLGAAGDLRGALAELERLSEMDLDPANRDEVETELARLYRQTGAYEKAVGAALEVESRGGDHAARASLERAASLRLAGDTAAATAVLETLVGSDDATVALEARAILARSAFDRGDLPRAGAILDGIAVRPEPALVQSGVLATKGLVALARGHSKEAARLFEMGLSASRAMGDPRHEARFCGLLGMVFHGSEQWEDALDRYRSALGLAVRAGDRHGAATYMVNLAAAFTEVGRVPEALSTYRDGLKTLRLVGRPAETARAGTNYAELLLRMRDVNAADTASARALADARRAADPHVLAATLCVRGDVLMHRGRLNAAEKMLTTCREVSEEAGVNQTLAACCLHFASLELKRDAPDQALRWLDDAQAAGCDDGPSLSLEARRLRVEAALNGSGEAPADALAALTSVLPPPEGPVRFDHLNACATVARGAMSLGDNARARMAAMAVMGILQNAGARTPSLHRGDDSPLLKEMSMILNATMTSGQGGAGDAGWEHLVRINGRLNSEFRIGRLLDMIMDSAIDISGAERGFLLIVNQHDELKVRCARHMEKQSLAPGEQTFSQTVAMRAFELGEPVLTTDASEDERFHDRLSVVNLNLRYIVAVPLKVAGQTTGTIYLDSRSGARFDDVRLAQLEALATQAALALTNARLRAENRRRQARIERLNRELQSRLESREGELARVKGELEKRTDALITQYRYDDIVARSKPMAEVFRLLDRVVGVDIPVIIEGDSGTGKELVARAIHFNGPRNRKPFVVENCAAIPETLLESVLFGHVKGAFTGAVSDSRGLFVEADGGTLFLDEIAEMPLSMQTKLLRVLQNGEVRPLGGAKTINVDVRIVVASNADLRTRVKRGGFREDLFYRLNVIKISLPSLRHRREDIPLLAEHFVQKHRGKQKKTLSKEAIEALMDHPWPGNVRQLENEIIRALVLCDDVIRLQHLSEDLVSDISRISDATVDLEMGRQVDRLKRRLIAAALKRTGGNQSAAAKLLGLSRFGLQKMMTRLEG